jgi:hypothetical protein
MGNQPPRNWLPLAVLAAALVIWSAMLALGAYLQLGADQPRHDIRRALIVLASMGTFLGIWAAALWLRSRRQR